MDCPRCRLPLRDTRGAAICLQCGGAFLDAVAADSVVRALDESAQRAAALAGSNPHATRVVDNLAKLAHVDCPVCHTRMQRFAVGPVDVDTCVAHGTWYDRCELEDVRDVLTSTTTATATTTTATTTTTLELARPPPPRDNDDNASHGR